MSNTQGPFGFLQNGTVAGNAPNYAGTGNPPYRISSSYGTAIGFGDPVTLVSGASPTGYLQRWVNGSGTATFQVAGIFFGCKYFSTARQTTWWSRYWPGSDATGDVEAFVCDDPNALFVVQATTNITQAMIGQTSDCTLGTVNTTTGFSGASLDAPSTTNPQYLPFKIVSLITTPPGANGTDAASNYNNVVVGFNNQIHKNLVTVHS